MWQKRHHISSIVLTKMIILNTRQVIYFEYFFDG